MERVFKIARESGLIVRRINVTWLVGPSKVIGLLFAAGLSATMSMLAFVYFVGFVRLAIDSTNASVPRQLTICAVGVIPAGLCLLELWITHRLCRDLKAQALRWLYEDDVVAAIDEAAGAGSNTHADGPSVRER